MSHRMTDLTYRGLGVLTPTDEPSRQEMGDGTAKLLTLRHLTRQYRMALEAFERAELTGQPVIELAQRVELFRAELRKVAAQ